MAGQLRKVFQLYYSGNSLRYFGLKKKLGDFRAITTSFCDWRAGGEYEKFAREMNRFWGARLLQHGLPADFVDQVKDVLKKMDTSKELFLSSHEGFLDSLNALSEDCLDMSMWKTLSSVMTSNGLFRAGQICREKAACCARKKKGTRFLLSRFQLAMEDREYEEAHQLIARMEKNPVFRQYLKEELALFRESLAVMRKDEEGIRENYSNLTEEQKEYYDFISERCVGLVGPAPGENEDFDGLKGVDEIVRFNYRGKDFLDQNQRDYQTNISYYSLRYCEWIAEQESKDFLEEMDYMICDPKNKSCFPKEQQKKVLGYESVDSLFFMGKPNMLPKVLRHLCMCGKNGIEIYRNNLYLGKNIWSKEYNVHSKETQREMFWWPSFALHELTSQFAFLQNMYVNQLIRPDEELKRVLELTKEEYVAQMEEYWVLRVIPYKMNVNWKNLG